MLKKIIYLDFYQNVLWNNKIILNLLAQSSAYKNYFKNTHFRLHVIRLVKYYIFGQA